MGCPCLSLGLFVPATKLGLSTKVIFCYELMLKIIDHIKVNHIITVLECCDTSFSSWIIRL